MNNKFLPFALPEIGQSEIDEVIDSLKAMVDNHST